MRRFFVEEIGEGARSAVIGGEEFVHLKRVLRLKEGDEVAVFNGKGLELTGVITSIGRASARVEVTGISAVRMESPLNMVLLQGLLKGDKPEFIVQKAVELGVKEAVFYTTPRTVPLAGKAKEKRLLKASIEAAKQCGRSTLPEIRIVDLKEALADHEGFLKIMLFEREGAVGLKEALKNPLSKNGVALLVGPEGSLTDEEARYAERRGFVKASLGPRILRAETAALAALTIVQYELGDLNVSLLE